MRLTSLIDQVEVDDLKYPPFRARAARRGSPKAPTSSRRSASTTSCCITPISRSTRSSSSSVALPTTRTLLRSSRPCTASASSSELMEALLRAARRGKEVTVVVELFARFDEEANINWAEKLEQEGAQVVYGVFGLKTHAKLALLLRREGAPGQSHARALRAPGHRQLPSAHDAALLGLRIADRGRRHLCRRQRSVPAHHESRQGVADEAAAARAVHDAPAYRRGDPARGAARARRSRRRGSSPR